MDGMLRARGAVDRSAARQRVMLAVLAVSTHLQHSHRALARRRDQATLLPGLAACPRPAAVVRIAFGAPVQQSSPTACALPFRAGMRLRGVCHGTVMLPGEGKLVYGNGNVYTGWFQNGVFARVGVFAWNTRALKGNVFTGEYKENKRHGHGSLVCVSLPYADLPTPFVSWHSRPTHTHTHLPPPTHTHSTLRARARTHHRFPGVPLLTPRADRVLCTRRFLLTPRADRVLCTRRFTWHPLRRLPLRVCVCVCVCLLQMIQLRQRE